MFSNVLNVKIEWGWLNKSVVTINLENKLMEHVLFFQILIVLKRLVWIFVMYVIKIIIIQEENVFKKESIWTWIIHYKM